MSLLRLDYSMRLTHQFICSICEQNIAAMDDHTIANRFELRLKGASIPTPVVCPKCGNKVEDWETDKEYIVRFNRYLRKLNRLKDKRDAQAQLKREANQFARRSGHY